MLEKSIQGRMIFRYQPHPSLPQKSGFSKKLMLEWDIFKSQRGGGRGGWILELRVWGQTGMTTTRYSDLQEREIRLNLDF